MECIRIVVAADKNYFPQLMIFTHSLREHTTGPIELTLLCYDLPERLRRRFLRFSKKLHLSAHVCEVNGEKTAGFKLMEHLTQAVYFRFEIPRLFEGGRVLWLDIDTVVLKDLRPFYEQELNGALVAAAPGNNGEKHLRRLGLDESCTYFNAGVILFNLDRIREVYPDPDHLYQLYHEHEEKVWLLDQDVLNIAYAHCVKPDTGRIYNRMVLFTQPLTPGERRKLEREAALIHYIRNVKPWKPGYPGDAAVTYRKAMAKVYPVKTILLVFLEFAWKIAGKEAA